MQIAAADLKMSAQHTRLEQREVSENLRVWVGDRDPEEAPAAPAGGSVSLSEAGKAAQAEEAAALGVQDEDLQLEPKVALLKSIIEALTGKKIRLMGMEELRSRAEAGAQAARGGEAPPQRAGYGMVYDYQESYTEAEATSFAAEGVVRTKDGQEIRFSFSLEMSRYYHEESSFSLRAGDAVKKDPLILNFDGNAAQLSSQRFAFDIDGDGTEEAIPMASGGSGYLVLDRNGDGLVNDGSELFGPRSGNGFAELAEWDLDGNGWIDENDPVFERLRIWTKDLQGQDQLQSLADKGVAAIALQHVATPFDLKDAQNRLQASVLASGVFLQQNGGVGSIQQLDLTV